MNLVQMPVVVRVPFNTRLEIFPRFAAPPSAGDVLSMS